MPVAVGADADRSFEGSYRVALYIFLMSCRAMRTLRNRVSSSPFEDAGITSLHELSTSEFLLCTVPASLCVKNFGAVACPPLASPRTQLP